MMRANVGVLSGVALTPGVSKNGRLYTPALIERAVKRMQARLADPNGRPLTMLSHHAAGDDSLRICGQLTAASLNAAKGALFEATLADTDAGRTIAALTTPDKPFLRNVSIRGWWLGEVRKVVVDGVEVETADDLEIDGVDFTKSPGVSGAVLTSSRLLENAGGRGVVYECVEDPRVALGPAASDPRLAEAAERRHLLELAEMSDTELGHSLAELVLAASRPPAIQGWAFWAPLLRPET